MSHSNNNNNNSLSIKKKEETNKNNKKTQNKICLRSLDGNVKNNNFCSINKEDQNTLSCSLISDKSWLSALFCSFVSSPSFSSSSLSSSSSFTFFFIILFSLLLRSTSTYADAAVIGSGYGCDLLPTITTPADELFAFGPMTSTATADFTFFIASTVTSPHGMLSDYAMNVTQGSTVSLSQMFWWTGTLGIHDKLVAYYPNGVQSMCEWPVRRLFKDTRRGLLKLEMTRDKIELAFHPNQVAPSTAFDFYLYGADTEDYNYLFGTKGYKLSVMFSLHRQCSTTDRVVGDETTATIVNATTLRWSVAAMSENIYSVCLRIENAAGDTSGWFPLSAANGNYLHNLFVNGDTTDAVGFISTFFTPQYGNSLALTVTNEIAESAFPYMTLDSSLDMCSPLVDNYFQSLTMGKLNATHYLLSHMTNAPPQLPGGGYIHCCGAKTTTGPWVRLTISPIQIRACPAGQYYYKGTCGNCPWCQNGGVCKPETIDFTIPYNCSCPADYYGDICQFYDLAPPNSSLDNGSVVIKRTDVLFMCANSSHQVYMEWSNGTIVVSNFTGVAYLPKPPHWLTENITYSVKLWCYNPFDGSSTRESRRPTYVFFVGPPTLTKSSSISKTETGTETNTASSTATVTSTVTITSTESGTQSLSPSESVSSSPSISSSGSESETETQTSPPTPTKTSTKTFSETATDSDTSTVSRSVTETASSSETKSGTSSVSHSATETSSPSQTESLSSSVSHSSTETVSSSATQSATSSVSVSSSETVSSSDTETQTQTRTPPPTPTVTSTKTSSKTSSKTIPPTPTKNLTKTETEIATETDSNSISFSDEPMNVQICEALLNETPLTFKFPNTTLDQEFPSGRGACGTCVNLTCSYGIAAECSSEATVLGNISFVSPLEDPHCNMTVYDKVLGYVPVKYPVAIHPTPITDHHLWIPPAGTSLRDSDSLSFALLHYLPAPIPFARHRTSIGVRGCPVGNSSTASSSPWTPIQSATKNSPLANFIVSISIDDPYASTICLEFFVNSTPMTNSTFLIEVDLGNSVSSSAAKHFVKGNIAARLQDVAAGMYIPSTSTSDPIRVSVETSSSLAVDASKEQSTVSSTGINNIQDLNTATVAVITGTLLGGILIGVSVFYFLRPKQKDNVASIANALVAPNEARLGTSGGR